MAGIDRNTGLLLDGWQHTWQSIMVILTTRVGTRVMRRDFGADIPGMIDRPGTQDRIVDIVLACAEALDKWEPRFALRRLSIDEAGPDGVYELSLFGRYFPRGHLGDFSVYEDEREIRVKVPAAA